MAASTSEIGAPDWTSPDWTSADRTLADRASPDWIWTSAAKGAGTLRDAISQPRSRGEIHARCAARTWLGLG